MGDGDDRAQAVSSRTPPPEYWTAAKKYYAANVLIGPNCVTPRRAQPKSNFTGANDTISTVANTK